ncbi:hypothetical protein GGX14DRAFT_446783 [Mycena pura]|uniref:Uncharacterized protein n=1 Tax=Mycena pura TaxID=153505 RepID=A0AAD6YC00_9AGAR|nr:hypothetical protein GGX14DRAFT_446783 [Mycena pura]
MSVVKEHCTAFGIHPIPATIAKEDFEAKCEALVESFLELPVAQRNFLRFDILTQNDQIADLVTSLGLPEPQPVVCLRCEYETDANWAECLRDPDFVKAMEAGRSWGFHESACIFSADVVTKLESDATRDRNVVVAILRVPAHMSPAEFRGKIDALLDGIHELRKPSAIRSTMYVQNLNAEEHLQAAGFPPAQPALVLVGECKSWHELFQTYDDAEVMNRLGAAMKEFAFDVEPICISADVVVKFRRPRA